MRVGLCALAFLWFFVAGVLSCTFRNASEGIYYNAYPTGLSYRTGEYSFNPCTPQLLDTQCDVNTMACQNRPSGRNSCGRKTAIRITANSAGMQIRYFDGDVLCIPTARRSVFYFNCDYSLTGAPKGAFWDETGPQCTYLFNISSVYACPVITYSNRVCHSFTWNKVVHTIPAMQIAYASVDSNKYFINFCGELGPPLSINCGPDSAACVQNGSSYFNMGSFSSRKVVSLPDHMGMELTYTGEQSNNCSSARAIKVRMICDTSVYAPTPLISVFGDACAHTFSTRSAQFCPGTVKTEKYDECASLAAENSASPQTISINCTQGGLITALPFVSYGNATFDNGSCASNNERRGTCESDTAENIVGLTCLNQTSCTIGASVRTYGDPCSGITKRMFVRATCTKFLPDIANANIPPYIDPCDTDLRVCDQRVTCSYLPSNFSFICGDCPLGTTGSGYTFCASTCGNGYCNETEGETCLTCKADCANATCGVCGDLLCDASIGETCSNCFEDCGSCDNTCKYKCVNGECRNGFCVCRPSWSGPTCESRNQGSNSTIDPTKPDIGIVPDTGSENSPNFLLSLKSVEEVDINGNVLRSIDLRNLTFTRTVSFFGSNTRNNFSVVLYNRARLNVIIWQLENEPSTTIEFANISTIYEPHTIKVSVSVSNWPFVALRNKLHINMDSGAAGDINCVNKHTDSNDNIRWFMLIVNDVALYGQFLDKAVLDDRIHTISFTFKDDRTITAIVPHFWSYAIMDPQFSVLLDDPSATCGAKKKKIKFVAS